MCLCVLSLAFVLSLSVFVLIPIIHIHFVIVAQFIRLCWGATHFSALLFLWNHFFPCALCIFIGCWFLLCLIFLWLFILTRVLLKLERKLFVSKLSSLRSCVRTIQWKIYENLIEMFFWNSNAPQPTNHTKNCCRIIGLLSSLTCS